MVKEPTVPHDYRALLQSIPGLTVVGGQAVNLWAIVRGDIMSRVGQRDPSGVMAGTQIHVLVVRDS